MEMTIIADTHQHNFILQKFKIETSGTMWTSAIQFSFSLIERQIAAERLIICQDITECLGVLLSTRIHPELWSGFHSFY